MKSQELLGRTDIPIGGRSRSKDPFERPPYESFRYGNGGLNGNQGSSLIPLEGKLREDRTQLPPKPIKP